jgi:glycosyltransferase involved in cell wall biosynthesis
LPLDWRTSTMAPSVAATPFAKEWIRPYYLKWFYSRMFRDRYPPEFSTCWEYPGHTLDANLCDWMGEAGAQSDVLFLPAADWHARLQRSQHLATELARQGHRCFYLNPHLGREFPNPYPLSSRAMVSRLLPRVYELHVHLPREPVYHHRGLTAPEITQVVSVIEQCLKRARSVDPVVVVSLPLWSPVARRLKQRHGYQVIYDCHDLWSGFHRIHPDILSAESDLFALSDAVLFSARWLMDAKSNDALRSKSELVRNAVRPEDFDFVFPRNGTGRKTIGYAGSLDFWFDVESVSLAAKRHPEWDFLLLGRIEGNDIRELGKLPNVRTVGEVPYSSLRDHLASVDVCMIPFRISPLTMATNPLKLYEYFACGHPVVSSPLPEVLEFGDLVYIASTPNEFVAQLEVAMAETSPRKAETRRRLAERENWTARCSLLSPHLAQSRIPVVS